MKVTMSSTRTKRQSVWSSRDYSQQNILLILTFRLHVQTACHKCNKKVQIWTDKCKGRKNTFNFNGAGLFENTDKLSNPSTTGLTLGTYSMKWLLCLKIPFRLMAQMMSA